jgi:hypothetical protein
MKGGNKSGNINFQISPHWKLRSNDLRNVYLKFDVEREFTYTTDTQLGQAKAVVIGDKQMNE